jgi:hypothetical protein
MPADPAAFRRLQEPDDYARNLVIDCRGNRLHRWRYAGANTKISDEKG